VHFGSARTVDAEGRDHLGDEKEAFAKVMTTEMGNAAIRCGRSGEMGVGVPVLCGKRGTLSGG